MREVDEALARAYAQHEQGNSPQGVPPAPHWPARALKCSLASTIAAGLAGFNGRAAVARARADSRTRMGRTL